DGIVEKIRHTDLMLNDIPIDKMANIFNLAQYHCFLTRKSGSVMNNRNEMYIEVFFQYHTCHEFSVISQLRHISTTLTESSKLIFASECFCSKLVLLW